MLLISGSEEERIKLLSENTSHSVRNIPGAHLAKRPLSTPSVSAYNSIQTNNFNSINTNYNSINGGDDVIIDVGRMANPDLYSSTASRDSIYEEYDRSVNNDASKPLLSNRRLEQVIQIIIVHLSSPFNSLIPIYTECYL